MQEDVLRDGEDIQLSCRPAPGPNIRPAGSEMTKGATVLDKGRGLGPSELPACAAAGAGILRVRRRLSVALLVTGDEVRPAGGGREAAQVREVNSPMLAASLASAGVELVASAHGADSLAGLVGQLSDMAAKADLVITTGGISVGGQVHEKPAFMAIGGGNPVHRRGDQAGQAGVGRAYRRSALARVARHPGLCPRSLEGARKGVAPWSDRREDRCPTRRHVVTESKIRRKPGRCELRPATLAGFDALGREVVRVGTTTQSGRVRHLQLADGLMFLPADADSFPAGALVEFQPFCQS